MSERPRLRTDLVLVEQTYRGRAELHRQGSHHPEVLPLPPGRGRRHADRSTASAPWRRPRPPCWTRDSKVSAAAVGKFAEKLKAMGLCERTLRESSVLLMERLRAQRRARLRSGRFKGDILRLRWSMGDPDEFMDRTLPYLRFFFTRGFLIASVALFAVYFVILALKWPEFVRAMSDVYLLRASLGDYVLLWVVTSWSSSPCTSWPTATPASIFGGTGARDRRDDVLLRAGLLLQRQRRLDLSRAQGAALGHRGGILDRDGAGEPRRDRLVGRGPRHVPSDVALAVVPGRRVRRGAGQSESADSARRLLCPERLAGGAQPPPARLRPSGLDRQDPVARAGPADAAGRRAGAADLPPVRHTGRCIHRADLRRRRRGRLRLAVARSSGPSASRAPGARRLDDDPAAAPERCAGPWPTPGGSCGRVGARAADAAGRVRPRGRRGRHRAGGAAPPGRSPSPGPSSFPPPRAGSWWRRTAAWCSRCWSGRGARSAPAPALA